MGTHVGREKGKKMDNEGGEALAQVSQKSCGCPIPGKVQGQVGWGL